MITCFEDHNGFVQSYDESNKGAYWYVLQTPRNKALAVKTFLEENSIGSIVPMHYQDVVRRGKTSRELVSALDNKIYIKAELETVRWVKSHLPYLTYANEELVNGKRRKTRLFIENEILHFFRLLETNYLNDILIVSDEEVWDDNFTYLRTKSGMFKDIPLFFENVKEVSHKCLVMTLDYDIMIAVKSLTPETFMTQECVMSQQINGEMRKTVFPLAKTLN